MDDINKNKRKKQPDKGENVLSELEQRFIDITNNAQDWVWEVDANGKYIYSSPAVEKILGYTQDEILEKHFYDFFHPDDRESLKRGAFEVFASKEPFRDFINRNVRKDGNEVWISTSGVPVLDSDGNLAGYRGCDTDITVRKIAADRLTQSERRFKEVASLTTDIVWEGDIRTNTLNWFGDIDKWLGYEYGEFSRIASGYMDYVHPADIEKVDQAAKQAIETGNDFFAAYRVRCKNGEYRYWEERGRAVEFEDGKAIRWIGAITDITDKVIAEFKIAKSTNEFKRLSTEFKTLMDAIPDELILLGQDMKILWANRAFITKVKGSGEEIYGHRCHEECCGVSRPCDNCPVVMTFQSGREESSRVIDGEGRMLDKRAVPIFDNAGRVENVIEVTRDITANVRMEEESRRVQSQLIHANKMTSLGILVSGVAHEINNPNSFIHHNAQTLEKIIKDAMKMLRKYSAEEGDFRLGGVSFSKVEKLAPELLKGINEGSVRIKKFVESLKDFSRPEKGAMSEDIDINSVVMTSRNILNNHIRKHTDRFSVHCEEKIPSVKGNAQRIEQVIINIIMNALQALPGKKAGIEVATSYDKKSENVVIAVRDEGKGIPDDILEKITDPFFTTKTESGGVGIGLSITSAIVKDHGGSLAFSSKVGEGTTVIIKLPVTGKSNDEKRQCPSCR